MQLEEQYERLEEKKKTKAERKAEKLQFLREKREGLEEKKAYHEEVTGVKAKIRELKGEPFYKKVGEGAIVGIKKGAAALKKEAPRAARGFQAVSKSFGMEKSPTGSIFSGSIGNFGKAESYFGDKGLGFGGARKEESYFGKGGFGFGLGAPVEKPTTKRKPKKERRKKKTRKARRKR